MSGVVLCRTDEIAEGQARGFLLGDGLARRDVIVVRCGGMLKAYVNACPHQGTPLDTFPDKLLNEDGTLFVCSTHGARFRVDDGLCVSGPCQGKALATVAFEQRDGVICVRLDP